MAQIQFQQHVRLPPLSSSTTKVKLSTGSRATVTVALRSGPIAIARPLQTNGIYFQDVVELPPSPSSSTKVERLGEPSTRRVVFTSPRLSLQTRRRAKPLESFEPRTLVFVDELCVEMPDPTVSLEPFVFSPAAPLPLIEAGDPYRGGGVVVPHLEIAAPMSELERAIEPHAELSPTPKDSSKGVFVVLFAGGALLLRWLFG